MGLISFGVLGEEEQEIVPLPTACPLLWIMVPTPPTALPATFPAAVMPLDSIPMAVFWI